MNCGDLLCCSWNRILLHLPFSIISHLDWQWTYRSRRTISSHFGNIRKVKAHLAASWFGRSSPSSRWFCHGAMKGFVKNGSTRNCPQCWKWMIKPRLFYCPRSVWCACTYMKPWSVHEIHHWNKPPRNRKARNRALRSNQFSVVTMITKSIAIIPVYADSDWQSPSYSRRQTTLVFPWFVSLSRKTGLGWIFQ